MAYTAELQIAVKGAQQLKALKERIEQTAKSVDRLNNDLKTLSEGGLPRTINNLTNLARQAAQEFNNVALGTKEATDAAKAYATTTSQLNAGLRERAALLEKIVRQERAAAMVRAGITMPARQLLLPAAAPGSPAMSGGARRRITGPVERLGGARTEDQAAAALRLAENIKQQVRPLSQVQFLYAGIATEAAKLQQIKALPDSKMLDAAARGLQTIESIEKRRLTTAERRAQKLRAIEEYYADRGMANAGFGIQGPAVPPGGIPKGPTGGGPAGGRRPSTLANVALGAGFPLLFGGGPGAVIGGGLGGLVPGPEGFAAQIALSALGQQLDMFVTSLNDLAGSLGNPTAALTALENAGIKVNDAIKVQVESLMEQGEAYRAQQLIFEEVTKAFGPEAIQQLNAYDAEMKKLSDGYKDLTIALTAELLPALTGVLSFVNGFADRIKKMSETPIFKMLAKAASFIPSFAISKAMFDTATARGKELAAQQPATRDLDAATKAEMAEIRRKELLKQIKQAHKEELSLIEAKAMRQQGLVDITVRRMDMERSIASAANDAFLKVNDLEMQRAKNAGDTEKQYRLQLKRAQLIYQQTVLQVKQEQRKAELAVISSKIELKKLEALVAQKAAKGEAVAQDYTAIELQKQAVQLAYEGVSAAQQIAQYNLMGANAVRKMAIEQAKFNKNKQAGEAIGGAGVRVYGPSGTRAIGAEDPNAYLSRRLAQLGVTSGTYQQQAAATLVNNLVAQKREQLRAEYRQSTNQRTSIGESRYLAERGYADGGFVTRPTNAMVGEGGQPEYVIPASKMNDAMRRYSAGTRGEAVVTGAGASGGMNSTTNYSNQQNAYYGSGGGTSVNITTGPVMRLGNRNYVTVTDMQRGMAAAVGAAEANMMSRMSRSYAARRSMGL